MSLRNTPHFYGSVTKFFHWSVFILMAAQFTLGFMIMESVTGPDADPSKAGLLQWHHSIGLLILLLATARYIWRRNNPLPNWAPGLSTKEQHIAHWVESILYFVMFCKPISGMFLALADGQDLMFFNLFTITNFTGNIPLLFDVSLFFHMASGILFFLAWFIHIGMVIKHQFFKKDRLLNRMLPFTH
jgi:cytochrome b561